MATRQSFFESAGGFFVRFNCHYITSVILQKVREYV